MPPEENVIGVRKGVRAAGAQDAPQPPIVSPGIRDNEGASFIFSHTRETMQRDPGELFPAVSLKGERFFAEVRSHLSFTRSDRMLDPLLNSR